MGGFSLCRYQGTTSSHAASKREEAGFTPSRMDRSLEQIRADLMGFFEDTYPQMEVRIGRRDGNPAVLEIQFTDETFRGLYPKQRYHRLIHLIPQTYWKDDLEDTVWVELAPGEEPDDQHLDEESGSIPDPAHKRK